MHHIIFAYPEKITADQLSYFNGLQKKLEKIGYEILINHCYKDIVACAVSNTRIVSIIFDWKNSPIDMLDDLAEYKPNLPVFAISSQHEDIDLDLNSFKLNLDFLQFDIGLPDQGVCRITQGIDEYIKNILPPFTKQLMKFVSKNDYAFCTPGHQAGLGFQKTPVGTLFYDFYGPNIFRSDISISMTEMGSLLEHSGPHKEAEEFIAETFNADRSFIVTNGTSTSNKIVGMYAASDGDTILMDRNCHKSLTHFMMMVDVHPIYLKPTRNAYGIIGGIPASEFTKESIQAKLDMHPTATQWPVYAVITNSTYDGIFYNVDKIKKELDIKHIHFDSAWVPYTNFHPIYAGKYGMCGRSIEGKTIYETQSTHKLIAAFSQGSMIHIKGAYDESRFNEAFMMHTSTSPFYPLVASCEVSGAMMKGRVGYHVINEAILCAMDFRKEITKLAKENKHTWYYHAWQPKYIDKGEVWELEPKADWHGFPNIDKNHLYLDPVKVTLLLPGMKGDVIDDVGIPASIVAAYLEDHGIVVEKTGPYTLLFLFSLGITRAKSMRLLAVLNTFKQLFDENKKVKDVLPSIYEEYPNFYKNMRIQALAKKQHDLMKQFNLPEVLDHAFDQLPKFVMTPHQAYQRLVRNQIKAIPVDDLIGHTAAVMVLPYPPGIPLIMPGESVTQESKVILDYLKLLEAIGSQCPGFETEIHGLEKGDDGRLYIRVIDELKQ
ncbi:MAG: lysine decarboxylase LdcC [Gammaproteobacteria bacterium CG_4_10_14_0_8_um_filter_38_16]|nr:MAG: lysine decarboxylase LdcC [Gammaproteobacteria bacterium CG_4_10_14_0_8_um_filter_38_16]PJA03761.1 MAG: lysine decarboxylase LdcC [Gammaproteobacteria bacterium CG_4_10_14_0_2_um_filter_38_22]PJB10571.1 MAG: lysine decarboxylase LdcC [Gammaproteobacteria bacterium CG_4_9_14_3_um_filter_38_9]